jgi:glutamine amidotransferase
MSSLERRVKLLFSMCRMFAVRSDVPIRVDRAFEGLQKLAVEHKDGWGVARFDGHTPHIETSVAAAHQSTRFDWLSQQTSTTSLLAHIRLASVGTVHEHNTHPFYANGWAFMHNGTLRQFDAARAKLEAELDPSWRRALRGETDSERCFALFLTFLGAGRDAELSTVARALVRVMNVASALCDDPRDPKRSAMNFIVSDGKRLVATRRGRTLFTAEAEHTRFIASEQLWGDEAWQCVPEDGVITIDESLQLRQSMLTDWA